MNEERGVEISSWWLPHVGLTGQRIRLTPRWRRGRSTLLLFINIVNRESWGPDSNPFLKTVYPSGPVPRARPAPLRKKSKS